MVLIWIGMSQTLKKHLPDYIENAGIGVFMALLETCSLHYKKENMYTGSNLELKGILTIFKMK